MAKKLRKLSSTLSRFPLAESWPTIGVGSDIKSIPHFLKRLVEMKAQGLSESEVGDALRSPLEVRYCPDRSRYYYIGRRAAVVVELRDRQVIAFVTVLWASDRLWKLNPREEQG